MRQLCKTFRTRAAAFKASLGAPNGHDLAPPQFGDGRDARRRQGLLELHTLHATSSEASAMRRCKRRLSKLSQSCQRSIERGWTMRER